MSSHKWSPLPKVGRDVTATDYWTRRTPGYVAELGGPYHEHRLAVVERLLEPVEVDGRVCVDLGCGEGVLLERLARAGADAVGFDLVPEMVAECSRRLADNRVAARVEVGGVEALAAFDDASVEVLLAVNVLHYFTDEEDERFYREAARTVAPGGALVITHSNELFDLFTLNRYTVEFFATHFGCEPEEIATLLTRPDEPARTTFNVRENPLSYGLKLAAYGFDEAQQEFANLHPVPPLLMDPEVHVDIDKREYPNTLDWDERDRWKLLFTCSMFGSRAVRR